MSQANVEIAKQAVEALNQGDLDEMPAFVTPDFEFLPATAGTIEGHSYRGREGFEEYLAERRDAWEEFRPVIEEYRDLGDRVLGLGRIEGLGRGSGIQIDAPHLWIFDIRDGRISRLRTYFDHGEALRAAGLAG
jgi:ketosteroid isomerase-like protein